MNHLFLKIAGMGAWLITALAAINIGLAPFNYNFFQMDFFLMRPELVTPICYLFLAAGIVSLALFVMSFMGHCGCYNCDCKSSCKCR